MPRKSTAARAALYLSPETTTLLDEMRHDTWLPDGPESQHNPGRREFIDLVLTWLKAEGVRVGSSESGTVLVGCRPSPDQARRLHERAGAWAVYRDGLQCLATARIVSQGTSCLLTLPVLPDEIWRALGPTLEPVGVECD